MKQFFCLMCFLISFLTFACQNSSQTNYDDLVQQFNNSDYLTAMKLINQWGFLYPNVTSYVDQSQIVVQFPGEKIFLKKLPDSLSYVAIAPYINQTHSCEIHYPSSCRGELKNKTFFVSVRGISNAFFVTDTLNSLQNGFFELWLPRDKTFVVEVYYNGQSASEIIETRSSYKTCVTTMQLK